MPTTPRRLFSFGVAIFFAAAPVMAGIVWSDDFTGQADNTAPTRDFTGNTVNDWSSQSGDTTMIRIAGGLGNPGPSLAFSDLSTGALSVPRLQMTEFASFSTANAETPLLRLSFDWQVESFTSSATNEAFRVILRANNSSATGNQVILGFNRADLDDGDAFGSDLTFYAASPNGTSNAVATNTSAIGLIPGLGWQPGFDFGQYSTTTAADNDTDDLFYHFDLTYDFTSGLVNGTVARIALDATNGQSASFELALNAGLTFSNTDATDLILLASTNGVTGLSRFDNLELESIPEPSALGAILAGMIAITLPRRRR